ANLPTLLPPRWGQLFLCAQAHGLGRGLRRHTDVCKSPLGPEPDRAARRLLASFNRTLRTRSFPAVGAPPWYPIVSEAPVGAGAFFVCPQEQVSCGNRSPLGSLYRRTGSNPHPSWWNLGRRGTSQREVGAPLSFWAPQTTLAGSAIRHCDQCATAATAVG